MKNHKILIIGGAGYIGSHLVYELNDNNFQTIVLDDLSTGFIDNVDKRSEFIEGSFFDKKLGVMVNYDTIIENINDFKPDVVGMSGLITPSLDEMISNLNRLNSDVYNLPVLIGRSTNSKAHTAIKMAPNYENGVVVHVPDDHWLLEFVENCLMKKHLINILII